MDKTQKYSGLFIKRLLKQISVKDLNSYKNFNEINSRKISGTVKTTVEPKVIEVKTCIGDSFAIALHCKIYFYLLGPVYTWKVAFSDGKYFKLAKCKRSLCPECVCSVAISNAMLPVALVNLHTRALITVSFEVCFCCQWV